MRPSTLRLLAPAKVNFSLEVLGKRKDGYHEVRLLMAGVSLYDELHFRRAKDGVLKLRCDRPGLDVGPGNLIIKAARALQAQFGKELGAEIRLKKRIPLGGGLAGGSTDAAATLKGLNRLWALRLTKAQLHTLAAGLGSDVPFCLDSGWAIATGRGEKLEGLSQPRKLWVVLANPGFEVSTKWAYGAVTSVRARTPNLSRRTFRAIVEKDLGRMERVAVNDLEPVTAGKYREIEQLKRLMRSCGAQWTRMSGSGPTVLGLFENEAKAKNAYKIMKNETKVAVCTSTLGRIPKL